MAHESIPSIEALEQQVRELDRYLQATKALLEAARAYHQLVGSTQKPQPVKASPPAKPIDPPPRKWVFRAGTGPMHQTETTAAKLMESLNRPVSTGDIVKEQLSQGHVLPGNASNVVSARMSNSKKFEGRRGEGWWFVDRPWPGDKNELFNENGSATGAAEP